MSVDHPSRSGYRQQRRRAGKRRRRLRLLTALALLLLLLVLTASGYIWWSREDAGDDSSTGAAESGAEQEEGSTENDEGNAELGESALDEHSALLFVNREGETAAAAFVKAGESPTMILGLPANTLLQGQTRFRPLAELASREGYAAVGEGLASILGLQPESYAEAEWDQLIGGPEGDESPARTLMEELSGVASAVGRSDGEVMPEVELDGDAETFRAVLGALGGSVDVVTVLPGTTVEGIDFTYYEPDLGRTRALTGAEGEEEEVGVEVQNGSGQLGIAQTVSDLLSPLGYSVLPPTNAEDFPDVTDTELYAAPNVLAEADRIREMIGVGRVVEQEGLPAGRIIVVLGKDLSRDDLPSPDAQDGQNAQDTQDGEQQ